MPVNKKKVILALARANMMSPSDVRFDDFVAGKGRGMIVLLQYFLLHVLVLYLVDHHSSGPPGVGKTLTAETLSEHLQKPLYSVSSFTPSRSFLALKL
jgi:Cdc6-like AAA superfamily ATPase